jgi:hypothetical protein
MAEGTTAIDTALSTEGDADGTELIEFTVGTFVHAGATPSGPLQYIRDHEEVSARKLAPPFWGKPNVAWVLLAFIRELQTLEDNFWDILESRTLENADLTRLKVLGKLVGQPRHGFDTEDYRILIEARALANVSRGRASDLLAVLNLLLGEGDYVLTAVGNATLHLTALQPIDANGVAMVAEILPDTRAAGVGLQFLYSDSADLFLWGDLWSDVEEWGTVIIL